MEDQVQILEKDTKLITQVHMSIKSQTHVSSSRPSHKSSMLGEQSKLEEARSDS